MPALHRVAEAVEAVGVAQVALYWMAVVVAWQRRFAGRPAIEIQCDCF